MLQEEIRSAMVDALKAHEEVRLTTLRGLISAITNELISLKRKPNEILDDDGVLAVIKRSVKQHKDSIKQFESGNRNDLAEREREELSILEKYMPAQASQKEITEAIENVLNNMNNVDPSKTGIIVGATMKALSGNADGAEIKEIVEKILAQRT